MVAPIIEKLEHEFADKLVVVYRQFPLDMHKHALAASAAAEAAAEQGKFWEMNKMLYENQDAWASARTSARSSKAMRRSLDSRWTATKQTSTAPRRWNGSELIKSAANLSA
jgi:hypothetical protein